MKSVVFVSAVLPVLSIHKVTDLFVIATDHGTCSRVGTRGNSDGNLNQGISHGEKLGLCYEETSGGELIADLKLMKADKEKDWQDGLCQDGWKPIGYRSGANGDLNQGKHGKYITLCKKYDENHQKAITGIYLQSDTRCPSGYDLVPSNNGDSNVNQHGHEDGKKNYLCMEKTNCDPIEQDITGFWNPLKRVAAGESFSFSIGLSESHTSSWSHSVSNSISSSRTKVKVNTQGSKSSLTTNAHTVGNVVSESSTSTLHTSVTDTIPWSSVGQTWQWVTEVPTKCGTKARIYSARLVLSTDSNAYPCCFPDRTYDVEDAHKCITDADIFPGGKDRGCKSKKAEELDLDTVEVV